MEAVGRSICSASPNRHWGSSGSAVARRRLRRGATYIAGILNSVNSAAQQSSHLPMRLQTTSAGSTSLSFLAGHDPELASLACAHCGATATRGSVSQPPRFVLGLQPSDHADGAQRTLSLKILCSPSPEPP